MASFVHSFRYRYIWTISQKEYRKLKLQKPHIFSFQPRVGSDIWANFITAYSVYLLSDDPEMSYLFIYLIHLSYSFIHSFIFYFPPSAVCIRRPFPHFTGTLPQYSYNCNVQVHNYYTSPWLWLWSVNSRQTYEYEHLTNVPFLWEKFYMPCDFPLVYRKSQLYPVVLWYFCDDGNENDKKQEVKVSKKTTLPRATRFFFSLHDYLTWKFLNFTFCLGREHKTANFFFFSCTLIQSLTIKLHIICQHLT